MVGAEISPLLLSHTADLYSMFKLFIIIIFWLKG